MHPDWRGPRYQVISHTGTGKFAWVVETDFWVGFNTLGEALDHCLKPSTHWFDLSAGLPCLVSAPEGGAK